MLFNSIPFIVFFPIVVMIYYLIPQKIRYIWLLVCSYFFYFTQSSSSVAFLILSTISTYLAGILLNRASLIKVKNLIVAAIFVVNIGLIVFFKYTNFFLDTVGSDRRMSLIVPIGISFYTLQALSYVMDCYRGKMETEKNLARYALYVSFFLTLLSGPINKGRDFMPELACDKKLDLDRVKVGMQKMLWGYFLKLVIAARLTILVDTAYANADGFSGSSLVVAAVCYLFMLYCDFQGYSCIAIGGAKILGIDMKENFLQPFYSTSMGELWRRWHVSLSTWFKEYVYFPLGGNRKGQTRKYINMMIIMFVSGLWHGANYTFFVWGLLNGFFLIMGNILIEKRNQLADRTGLNKHPELRRNLQRIGVYILYGFTMIFFASDNMSNALLVIRRIVLNFGLVRALHGEVFSLGLGVFNLAFAGLMCIIVLVVDGFCNKYSCDETKLVERVPTLYRWMIYIGIVTMIVFSANLSGKEFIYSQM